MPKSALTVLVPLCGDLDANTAGRTYTEALLNEIQRDDRGIHWIIGLEESLIKRVKQNKSEAHISWLPFPRWSVSSLGRLIFEQLRLPAIIRSTNPDVVFFSANFLTLLSKTPSVLAIRSLLYYHYPGEISKPRLVSRKFLNRRGAHKATRIVCPSQNIAREINQILDIPQERITTILHGTSSAYLEKKTDDAILDRLELRDRPYFLYPSALWEYKNHITLIRAAEKLADRGEKAVVVFAGHGIAVRNSHVDMLRREARNVKLPSEILFSGELDPSELNVLYKNAIALLFPSTCESFGNPIAEAMALDCPIVASSSHAVPEIVAGGGIILDALDANKWAGEMSRLANDALYRKLWSERASARKNLYLMDRAIDELTEVIRNAAMNPSVSS
ncbi:MAG: glycosyltransferase family 1 protein [Myxococcota bacterium]|nr:glycosyltransferase family 1 protein [Myxococcota bacterium]